jgi:cation diffusion facilitator family transporter
MTLIAVRVSSRPADTTHTYGHGKVENLSAMFETALLLLTCVWIIYEAVRRLFFQSVEVEASAWAFLVMAVSIAIDSSRSRILKRAAQKYHSQALEADALHFSTDIWSSLVVIGGLIFVWAARAFGIPRLDKADAIAALGVSGIVVYVSLTLGKKTIADLLDGVPPHLREDMIRAAHVPGVLEVRNARIRRAVPSLDRVVTHLEPVRTESAPVTEDEAQADRDLIQKIVLDIAEAAGVSCDPHEIDVEDAAGELAVSFHCSVDPAMDLDAAHRLTERFELALKLGVPRVGRVLIHIEPPEK